MKQVPLNAKIRAERGTAQARLLRAQGWVPAELYGLKEDNQSLAVPQKELGKILQGSGGESLFFDLRVESGQPILAVLREVQYDRLDNSILHADFQKVRLDEKVRVKVPIRVVNVDLCEGVKGGGTLQLFKRSLEAFCLPTQIPQGVEVDVAPMQINQSLHVSDLKLPEGLQVTDSPVGVVLTIAPPMAEEVAPEPAAAVVAGEAGAVPAEGAAPAEPEVLTAKKKEEEGETDAAKGKETAKEKAPAKK